jgi:hypothetical protein
MAGRHQGPLSVCVTRLSASLAAGGGLRRSAFDVGRVAGRRPGRVGRVLVEPLSQVIHVPLEGLHSLLILLNETQDRRLDSGRYLVPEFNRDRRNRRHTNILRPLEPQTSSGRERLHEFKVYFWGDGFGRIEARVDKVAALWRPRPRFSSGSRPSVCP